MIKEKYVEFLNEISLNVVQTGIESVRKKEIERGGLRVYDGKNIGIAGALGKYDEKELEKRAIKALDMNIPYPYEVSSNLKNSITMKSELSDEEEFVEEVTEMLEELKRSQPDFSFSNKINLLKASISLSNDEGLDLCYKNSHLGFSLIIKDKKSSNIIDAFTGYDGWKYDREEFLKDTNSVCEAYKRKADFEDGIYPVCFLERETTYKRKLFEVLNGLLYGSGSSILSGKMGEKLFNEDFTLCQSRNPDDEVMGPFFDSEGGVNRDYRYNFIENGVFVSPYTDKKTASMFKLPYSGSSLGEYDSVPSIGIRGDSLRIKESEASTKELLDGKKGVFALIASGGDFTPEGKFASPVQLSFLFDGEKFIGRLPQINISSHLYDMFGKDYIGVGKDSVSKLYRSNCIAMNMKVTRI